MNMNEIYLSKKCKLVIRPRHSTNSIQHLATLLKNLECLGYTLSVEVLDILKTYSPDRLERFQNDLVTVLKSMLGADVKYNPMYPNFPEQVMEMDSAELYFNAIMHYITSIWLEDQVETWLPEYEKKVRAKIDIKTNLKVIELGTTKEFHQMFTNMIGANVEMSPTDKEYLDWYIRQFRDIAVGNLPDKIPNKENLSYTIGLLRELKLVNDTVLGKYFSTATDVLRLITAQCDGDVSLTNNTKFKSFPRADRRFFLGLIENCNHIAEDMLRNKGRWIRIGEMLHPTEYQKRYPETASAFNIIRNGVKIKTFASQFVKSMQQRDIQSTLFLVKNRGGEFARRLDWILRTHMQKEKVIEAFDKVSDSVSTKVLLQVMEHFKHRNTNPFRAFIPKGTLSKIQLHNNTLPKISDTVCKQVTSICETSLQHKFAHLDSLGKCYVDSELINYPIPFAMRSASKSLNTISKGSRVDMGDESTIRLFIWWNQDRKTGGVDIDLSAVFISEDWKVLEHVSWTNLRNHEINSCHSGDITDAGKNGVSEFIDIDKKSAIDYGVRYVVMNVISFTGQQFTSLPKCYAGCMGRDKPQSGEIYEPSTVTTKFDLTTEARYCIPLIFDLKENKFIWTDIALSSKQGWYGRAVEDNSRGILAMLKAMVTLKKPNLYDLFRLHANARGTLVHNRKDADIIFSLDGNIKPTDIEIITSQYM